MVSYKNTHLVQFKKLNLLNKLEEEVSIDLDEKTNTNLDSALIAKDDEINHLKSQVTVIPLLVRVIQTRVFWFLIEQNKFLKFFFELSMHIIISFALDKFLETTFRFLKS